MQALSASAELKEYVATQHALEPCNPFAPAATCNSALPLERSPSVGDGGYILGYTLRHYLPLPTDIKVYDSIRAAMLKPAPEAAFVDYLIDSIEVGIGTLLQSLTAHHLFNDLRWLRSKIGINWDQ